MAEPVFTNDAVVLGILMAILAFVFISSKSQHPFWKKFYTYVPTLLLCYFIRIHIHFSVNLTYKSF